MAMIIWATAFCCLMLNTCFSADNNIPVGFKSIQKCREYQQEHLNIIAAPKINVAAAASVEVHISTNIDPDRIIFARSTDPKQKTTKFPYTAAIYDQQGNHKCGGTLISEKFILLQAHCMANQRFTLKNVVLGTDELDPSALNFLNISRTIPHPQYNAASLYYSDIGLIELEKPVTFSTNVRPACLSPHRYADGDDWFMVTWVIDEEPAGTRKQEKVIINTDSCQQIYQNVNQVAYGIIDHLQICVREHIDTAKQHQPISIVVSNKELSGYTVVGTPSLGLKRNNSGQVYTRVASYIKWIENIVWPDLPIRGCSKFNFDFEK